MLLAAAAIITGFIVLIWSADLFVAGAASIARNLGLSPIIIGLTIVSLGTSAPEVLVSLTASLAGSGSLAIGNAIGSNIANIALVLGTTVLIAPLMVREGCMKKEVPVLLVATFGVGLLVFDLQLSAFDGWLMIGVMVLMIVQLVRTQAHNPEVVAEAGEEPLPQLSTQRAWFYFVAGLLLLIGSSRLLVWGAAHAALELGVPELIIGLTIVAIGTSLPELAATVASAMRGHTEIALGNVIGSNLFNLLVVMAIPGIIAPQVLTPDALYRDYMVMSALTVFLAVAILASCRRSKSKPGHAYLGRIVGMLLVSSYGLYYYLLQSTL
ncbi:MAG: calcium/sodium antiporter [Halioglobus sp.]|nr:calcium/sodium antiporter [Halioglobus sp.]